MSCRHVAFMARFLQVNQVPIEGGNRFNPSPESTSAENMIC